MDHLTDTAQMLDQLTCPAFIVKNGIITQANLAALQQNIQLNTNISDLICIGIDEYKMYTQGKLCLTLNIEQIQCHATVTALQDSHLFCLTSQYESSELRALALAAQQLREPLSKALMGTEHLIPNAKLREDTEATEQLAQINRSLYQLLRAVSNMSDAATLEKASSGNMQVCEAIGVFNEILEKASNFVTKAERTLNFIVPKCTVYCPLDEDRLERAILNLLSNAIKFTPKGSTINATVQSNKNRLMLTVQSDCAYSDAQAQSNIFSRYLRQPGIEDGRNGIGLGMSIVHSVAAAHNGTVLIEYPENSGVKITMTASLKYPDSNIFRSPVKLPIDYAGGYDRNLLELSDVLPDSLFLENM